MALLYPRASKLAKCVNHRSFKSQVDGLMLGITEVAVVLPPPSLGDNYHSWCSGNSRESGAKNTQTAETDYGVGLLSDIRADCGCAPPGAGKLYSKVNLARI